MKRFEKTKGFILGVILTVIVCNSILPALADNIEAFFNTINITINGEKVASIGDSYKLADGTELPYSINHKGTVYLPLRKIGELYDKDIEWDDNTKTAAVNDKVPVLTSTEEDIEKSDNEIYNGKRFDYSNEISGIWYNGVEYLNAIHIVQSHKLYMTPFNSAGDNLTIDFFTREIFISNSSRENRKENLFIIPEQEIITSDGAFITKSYYETTLKHKLSEYEKLRENIENIVYIDAKNEALGFKLNGKTYYSMQSIADLCSNAGVINNTYYDKNFFNYNCETFDTSEAPMSARVITIPAYSYYFAAGHTDGTGILTIIVSVPEIYIKHLGGYNNPHIDKNYYETHVKPALRRYFNQWW